MAMVLLTLQPIQDNPPTEWLQFGDKPPVQKELIIQVCFMMGDQKSQDNITGHKLNTMGGLEDPTKDACVLDPAVLQTPVYDVNLYRYKL
jgi:hypothetical protein